MGVIASVSSTLSFGLIGGKSTTINPPSKQCQYLKLSGGHIGLVFGWLIPCLFVSTVALSMAELTSSMPYVSFLTNPSLSDDKLFPLRTSAGLYYFSAKLAPEGYGPVASWVTGTFLLFFSLLDLEISLMLRMGEYNRSGHARVLNRLYLRSNDHNGDSGQY